MKSDTNPFDIWFTSGTAINREALVKALTEATEAQREDERKQRAEMMRRCTCCPVHPRTDIHMR